MQHRSFGRTGLSVPALTFGGGWVGGVLIHRPEAEANAALDLAWDAGIDWVDTAASYGDGVSETVIGRWLAGRKAADRPRLSTKFRVDPGAGEFADQMLASVEASLGRLGLDRVDVIILHNPIGEGAGALTRRQAQTMAEVMEALRAEGLCDHLGLTALGDPAAVREVVAGGGFDVAQVYYNMLNPTAAAGRSPWNSTDFNGLLDVCADRDMGVMGIRIFAGGHLASTTRHGREVPITVNSGDAAEERRARVVWDALVPEDGTPAQAAIRFGLACKGLSTIVVGLGEIAHLKLAIEAEGMGPLPPDRLAAIAKAWEDPAFTG